MKKIMIVMVACVLAGCGTVSHVPKYASPEEYHKAFQKVDNACEGCREVRLTGELKGHAEEADCCNQFIIKAYQELKYPYMDLVYDLAEHRVRNFKSVDDGLLTETEATEAINHYIEDHMDRIQQQRDEEAARLDLIDKIIKAQETEALIQGLSSVAAAAAANQNNNAFQFRRPVTCIETGPFIRCY